MMSEAEEQNSWDDLADAWDTVEANNADQPEIRETEDTERAAPDGPEDSDGERAEPELVSGAEGETGLLEKEDGAGGDSEVAPKSLSPEAREEWNNVPESVKSEFKRIDDRMAGMAKKYGADANRARQMDQTLQPYQQFFAMNGGAQQTIPAVLQTAMILQMGSGPQKAEMVKNMIHQFGVDIKTLDSMLVGEQPQQDPNAQFNQLLDQRLAPLQQQLQSYQQQEQQGYVSEVQNFGSKNEFYEDVREDMADLMDMAANRGMSLTLDQAYERACRMHPQINKILIAREAGQQVSRKAPAAKSIHGTPGGSGAPSEAGSIREALEQAWETSGRV